MSDERDETRRFSPFDDATWADDEVRPGRGRSGDQVRRSSGAPRDAGDPTSPAREDPTRLQAGDPTRMQAGDPTGVRAGDATRVPAEDAAGASPRTEEDRTKPQPRADAPTVVDGPAGRRPADATSVMPAAADNPAWSGRAEVRPPQPARTDFQSAVDWPTGADPRQRDRWWMPIVVGIIVLVLLAALGWGIYLIVQNAGKNSNAPGPAVTTTAPAAPSTAATTQTTEPSSAPTTTTPTPTTSTTDPTDEAVAIPALRGLTVADAKSALHRSGIDSTRVIYRPSDGQSDTVIDSDPEEGQEVPPDTTVTLVVAAPATATPSAN